MRLTLTLLSSLICKNIYTHNIRVHLAILKKHDFLQKLHLRFCETEVSLNFSTPLKIFIVTITTMIEVLTINKTWRLTLMLFLISGLLSFLPNSSGFRTKSLFTVFEKHCCTSRIRMFFTSLQFPKCVALLCHDK